MKPTTPAIDRVLDRIVLSGTGCWLYTGLINQSGYGLVGVGPRGAGMQRAHRATYEHFVGAVPDGLDLDHLCRVRRCCNPFHLEPVTRAVNIQRGLRKTEQTHCVQGHEFTPENTKQTAKQRICLACSRARSRDYMRRKRQEAAA